MVPKCGTARGLRKKLPHANTTVANKTSHGTRRAKKLDGVTSSSTAPATPPTRLIAIRCVKERLAAPETFLRPVRPVAACAGKSAIVEVMFAARASMPVSISAGKVMKVPPPANAFCIPAHKEMMKRPVRRSICALESGAHPRRGNMLTVCRRTIQQIVFMTVCLLSLAPAGFASGQ
jgi:hypothetical protein